MRVLYLKHQARLDSSYKKRGSRINIPREHFPSLRREKVMQSQKPHLHRRLFRSLARQEVALNSEHLARGGRDEAVDLSRELLHLAGVQHAIQPAGLGGKLEQALPLVLGEQWLLEGGTSGVLLAALLLPVVDLLLLTAHHALVVLEVVDFGVMRFDAVQQEVAVLLEERVNAERQVVKIRSKCGGFGEWAALEGAERGRKVGGARRVGALQLVDEGGKQVRVVDLHRQLVEDVLVAEVGLLQSENQSVFPQFIAVLVQVRRTPRN